MLLVVDIALGVASRSSRCGGGARIPAAVGVLTAVAVDRLRRWPPGPALIAGVQRRAARHPARRSSPSSRSPRSSILVFPLLYPTADEPYLRQPVRSALLLTAVVIGWGLFARVRREHVLSLRERAARLEAEQRLRIEQAREAERRRIAREMHDVLAHRVSLLSLHAGALEFRPDAPPEEIAEAAGVIRATAHAALEELRAGDRRAARRRRAASAPEPPQPTLADIPALVEESPRGRACACAAGSTCPAGRAARPRSGGRRTGSCRRA